MNVADLGSLKKELREANSEYVVEKKTLVDKSLKQMGKFKDLNINIYNMAGSLGMVFGYGDELTAAKSIYGFSKKNPALKYFGAVFGDRFLDASAFADLAKLPGREILISRIAGLMKYHLVMLLSVLSQLLKKKTASQ